MNRIFGRLMYEECECHPLPSFGPFKRYRFSNYYQESQAALMGLTMIKLARPYKGQRQFGIFLNIFGSIWIVNFAWTNA
jgi:hypothetical protein